MSTIVYGEEAVLLWSDQRASQFGLRVTDFSSSWNDGRAVTAIINTLFPKDFDYRQMTFADPKKDMQKAFESLKKNKIVIYLEPEDFLVKKPDPKSVTLFAAELMKFSQGNYEGYDETKFLEAKRKREEEERKEEEEAQKRKQDALDALPKCTSCQNHITTYAYEFCGYPYHDTCLKCLGCGKQMKFKGMAIANRPYCELCARNCFQKLKADGWVPPEGVRAPINVRIGKFTGDASKLPPLEDPLKASKKSEEKKETPVQKKEEEKKVEKKEEVKKEPEVLSRTVVGTAEEGDYIVETIEEIVFDPSIGKKKKRIIKKKSPKPAKKEEEIDEDEELRRLEEEERRLQEEEEELRRLEEEEEELRRLEEELAREEAALNDD